MSAIWGAVTASEAQADSSWLSDAAISLAGIQAADSAHGTGQALLGGRIAIDQHPHRFLQITADVQLHNRRELIAALLPEARGISATSDEEILLAAYEKWDIRCPDFLLGDFAFAIWDSRVKRLFCCRDHLGARPFFYWQRGGRFLFASSPQTILKVTGVDFELNRRKLAGVAIPGGHHFYHDETFYKGIQSLPFANWLTVDHSGVRNCSYWRPTIKSNLVPRREEEAYGTLRDLLFQAVGNRIESGNSVAVLLSGGLDSSAVTAIAARCLASSNRCLTAMSSVVTDENRARFTDEREYIEEFREWPNIQFEYVSASGRGPFDLIDNPKRLEATTFLTSSRAYLYEAFTDVANSRGIDLILDGEAGELGPTCHGHGYFLELAVRMKWPTLLRELRAFGLKRNLSPVRVFGSQFLKIMFPNRRRKPLVFLTGPFQRECEARRLPVRRWPDQRKFQMELFEMMLRMHANPRGTAPHPLRFASPLVDKRVVEYCIAAPARLKVRDGYTRSLIRMALEGVLPRRLQWRTNKQAFSPDYPARYTAQLGKARDFVAAIGSRDPVRSIVDVDRLGILLDPRNTPPESWIALISIPATVYLICFLRQFPEYRR